MTTREGTYISPARGWSKNQRAARVHEAMIETPFGDTIPGVRIIDTSGAWFLLTEANAVKLATDVLAAVEAGRKAA